MRNFLQIAVLALQFSAAAFAAEPARNNPDEAKKHFQRSRELYDEGDFAGALKEIERSYASFPNFKLLYNMGQIQAQQQDYAPALKSFRKFLAEGANEVPEARRAEVLKEIDKLRTRVGEVSIAVNVEGAEISVDDQVVGRSPLSEAKIVNIGKRKVSATLPNHFPVTKFVDVAGLDTLTVKLELQPMVAAGPNLAGALDTKTSVPTANAVTVKPVETTPFRIPVWAPWVATGVLAAGTTVFAFSTLTVSNEQKARLARFGVTAAQLEGGAKVVQTRALITDILGGATLAAAAGSLLYTLFRAPEVDPSKPTALQFGVAPNGLFVSGEF